MTTDTRKLARRLELDERRDRADVLGKADMNRFDLGVLRRC